MSPRPAAKTRQRAIEAARKAFDDGPWPKMSGKERAEKLRKVAEIINGRSARDRRDRGARRRRHDQEGDVRRRARARVSTFQCFADCAENEPDVDRARREPVPARQEHRAARAVSACARGIVPWNFPFLMAGWKIAPAIAAGNCVGVEARELHVAVARSRW